MHFQSPLIKSYAAILAIVAAAGYGLCQNSGSTVAPASPKQAVIASAMFVKKNAELQFDTIAGELPSLVKAQSRPYLVTGNIDVAQDKTVTIEKGAVFLFRNFTGLHVEGKLIVLGTKQEPVIFTSENDQAVNPASTLLPNPFDWDGVYIHAGAIGTSMAFCSVSYSVYGIFSETKFIRLDPVTLLYNGKSNLVVEGKEYPVSNTPYSYILSVKDARIAGVPVTLLVDPLSARRVTFRVSGLAVLALGSAASAYYGVQWRKAQLSLSQMSTDDPLVLKNYPYAQSWTDRRNSRNNAVTETAVAACIGVIGCIGFWYSFTF